MLGVLIWYCGVFVCCGRTAHTVKARRPLYDETASRLCHWHSTAVRLGSQGQTAIHAFCVAHLVPDRTIVPASRSGCFYAVTCAQETKLPTTTTTTDSAHHSASQSLRAHSETLNERQKGGHILPLFRGAQGNAQTRGAAAQQTVEVYFT
jgi:hypothetical protein